MKAARKSSPAGFCEVWKLRPVLRPGFAGTAGDCVEFASSGNLAKSAFQGCLFWKMGLYGTARVPCFGSDYLHNPKVLGVRE